MRAIAIDAYGGSERLQMMELPIPEVGPDDAIQQISDVDSLDLMEWLYGFQNQYPHIPADGRAKIYQALVDAGRHFTWHEFNAEHAFMRDEGPRYDPDAARTAMGIALALFHRRLD